MYAVNYKLKFIMKYTIQIIIKLDNQLKSSVQIQSNLFLAYVNL